MPQDQVLLLHPLHPQLTRFLIQAPTHRHVYGPWSGRRVQKLSTVSSSSLAGSDTRDLEMHFGPIDWTRLSHVSFRYRDRTGGDVRLGVGLALAAGVASVVADLWELRNPRAAE